MLETTAHKVKPHHLAREACVYVRQSSLRQVETNTESAHRQYGLRRNAIALGWGEDRIRVIDDDQGKSATSAADRSGFRDLMARIAAGEVGIVLSLEISRLARNNHDWSQLLQVARIADTLILDEAGPATRPPTAGADWRDSDGRLGRAMALCVGKPEVVMAIDTVTDLRQVYRPPAARAGLKVLNHLDVHCRKFIALSPFYVISSARADGRADASPRGDRPGSLAHVLDDKTLLLGTASGFETGSRLSPRTR